MLKIEIKLSGNKNCKMQLPTKIEEITPEYLKEVTNEIVVPRYYALIGLISKESPAGLVLSLTKKNKNGFVSTIPVFIKANDEDKKELSFMDDLQTGQVIVVSGSDLSISNHVNCKNNSLATLKILSYLTSSKENHTKAIGYSTSCYFVDFKIISISAIHGAFDESKLIEPTTKFVEITSEEESK